MSRHGSNRGRTVLNGDAPADGHPARGGQDRPDAGDHSTIGPGGRPMGDPPEDDPRVFEHLRRMYGTVAGEPLPSVFRSLVRRLRGGNGDGAA